jgi:hypothetical protein
MPQARYGWTGHDDLNPALTMRSTETRSMSKTFSIVLLTTVFGLAAPMAHADQPHMRQALRALMAARHQLEVASPNKGGWRMRAIAQVDQSIASVKAGMRFANHH